jgi:hypothetical protein
MASLRKTANTSKTTATPTATLDPTPMPAAPDGASAVLQAQLDALRRSEDLATRQSALAAETNKRRQEWLNNNPTAQQHLAELNVLHQAAIAGGLTDSSPEYFTFLEAQLASLPKQAAAGEHLVQEIEQRAAQRPAPPPSKPARIPYSAPVSRQVIGTDARSGRTELTGEQKEAAKIAGISEMEYSRQLERLNALKATGEYLDRR